MFLVFIHVRYCENTNQRTHNGYYEHHDEGEVVGKKQGEGLGVIDHEKLKIIKAYNLKNDEDFGEEVSVFEPEI